MKNVKVQNSENIAKTMVSFSSKDYKDRQLT